MQDENTLFNEYVEMINEIIDEYGTISPQDKINCYVCKCGCIIKTIEVNHGVAPGHFKCESCGSLAEHTNYNDVAPDASPTHEWYRPTFEELLNMRDDEEAVYFILLGGLCIRKTN